MYDPQTFKEPQAGVKTETKISKIEEGLAENLRRPDYWKKMKVEEIELAKKQPSIRITTESGADVVISIPKDGVVKKKMKLAKWKSTYGAYPFVGQKVITKTDESGYSQIVLED